MRSTLQALVLLLLVAALTACQETRAYTKKDLVQVRHTYSELVPVYVAFKHAYYTKKSRALMREYHREQVTCRTVDAIDQRDTIDPKTDLFQASVGLDTLCNSIESAYAVWAKSHGRRYDKALLPGQPAIVFLPGDVAMQKVPAFMRHPAALSS